MGLIQSKFIAEGWQYYDEIDKKWKLKEEATQWEKKEFEEFYVMVNSEPDEDGIATDF